MSKQKKLLILLGLFVVLGGIYWGLGSIVMNMTILYIYYALCMILSVLYILVAGGIRPIVDEDRRREEKSRKQYLADKGKLHPIKRRDKYRRFRVKGEGEEKISEEQREKEPAPNLLNIPEEKRPMLCTWLLLCVLPFYLILLIDWVFLKFFS
ncbi:MAG: hypothetical protein E7580_06845 [Ruminococcaceae bacterium]|nr:hypothetical protein [Oscillospiraceae bacterium]